MGSHIKPLALARLSAVTLHTKMKHESQLGYADILVLFFSINSSLSHCEMKMRKTRMVIYFLQ